MVFYSCVNEQVGVGRSYTEEYKSIILRECVFTRNSEFSDDGGVMKLFDCKLEVYDSAFYSCSSLKIGGAIYLYRGSAIIEKTCVSRCFAKNQHFAYLSASGGEKLSMLSIFNTSFQTIGNTVIECQMGIQVFSNNNLSRNYCEQIVGPKMNSMSSISFRFSLFENNVAKTGVVLYFISASKGKTIDNNNFINNTSPSQGVVYSTHSDTELTVYRCIFINNTGFVFCVGFGSMIVNECPVYHKTGWHSGKVTFANTLSTLEDPPIYSYYYSRICEIPVVSINSTKNSVSKESWMRFWVVFVYFQ